MNDRTIWFNYVQLATFTTRPIIQGFDVVLQFFFHGREPMKPLNERFNNNFNDSLRMVNKFSLYKMQWTRFFLKAKSNSPRCEQIPCLFWLQTGNRAIGSLLPLSFTKPKINDTISFCEYLVAILVSFLSYWEIFNEFCLHVLQSFCELHTKCPKNSIRLRPLTPQDGIPDLTVIIFKIFPETHSWAYFAVNQSCLMEVFLL